MLSDLAASSYSGLYPVAPAACHLCKCQDQPVRTCRPHLPTGLCFHVPDGSWPLFAVIDWIYYIMVQFTMAERPQPIDAPAASTDLPFQDAPGLVIAMRSKMLALLCDDIRLQVTAFTRLRAVLTAQEEPEDLAIVRERHQIDQVLH